MSFNGCFLQQLKALLAYLSRINFFKIGKLDTVGAHGSTGGVTGGSSLRGQEHVFSLDDGTPELEHCVGLSWPIVTEGASSHSPTCGKSGLTMPRSTQASNDKYGDLTVDDT